MDIEFVSLDQAELPDAFSVTFDVIYAGETWCRSVVMVESAVAAGFGFEGQAITSVARDALLELLMSETGPVSLHLRLATEGTTVLGRGTPGGAR
jgi:hypothetical protein